MNYTSKGEKQQVFSLANNNSQRGECLSFGRVKFVRVARLYSKAITKCLTRQLRYGRPFLRTPVLPHMQDIDRDGWFHTGDIGMACFIDNHFSYFQVSGSKVVDFESLIAAKTSSSWRKVRYPLSLWRITLSGEYVASDMIQTVYLKNKYHSQINLSRLIL